MSRADRAYNGVFWSALNAVINNGANLAIFVILSRTLTPTDFGVVAMAGTVVALFACLLPFGFGEALVQRAELRGAHADATFWLCLLSGCVAFVLCCLSAEVAAGFYGSQALAAVTPALAVRLIFDALNIVPSALITREVQFRKFAIRSVVATSLAGGCAISLAMMGWGVWSLVALQVIGAGITAIVSLWSSSYWPRSLGTIQGLVEVRKYGLYASVTRAMQFLNGHADQVVLGVLLGPEALGLYAFARRVFVLVTEATSGVLASVTHSVLANVQTEPHVVRQAFLTITKHVSLVAFPLFIGLALVSHDAVPLLFGEKWAGASTPIALFSILGLISCIGTLQASLINALGKTDWWFSYQLLVSLSNVAVYVFAGYMWGMVTMVALFVAKAYLLWPITVVMTSRLVDISWRTYIGRFVPSVISVLVMALSVMIVRDQLPLEWSVWMKLCVEISAGAAVYGASVMMLAPQNVIELASSIRRALRTRSAPSTSGKEL